MCWFGKKPLSVDLLGELFQPASSLVDVVGSYPIEDSFIFFPVETVVRE